MKFIELACRFLSVPYEKTNSTLLALCPCTLHLTPHGIKREVQEFNNVPKMTSEIRWVKGFLGAKDFRKRLKRK